VTLWMYEKDLAEETQRTRENRVYLPGFTLPANISVNATLDRASGNGPSSCPCPVAHSPAISTRMAPFLANDASS